MDLGDTTNSSVKYRRRLDRTPDKSFVILQEDDKIRLNTLRSTLEAAKSRIVRLRDENDEKDYIIDEERKLRQAAEENLHKTLVDLYNNPDVISELRHRLPRARKVHTTTHEPATIMDDYHQPSNLFDGVSAVREDMETRYGYLTDDGGATYNINKKNRSHVVLDVLSQPLPATSFGREEESLRHIHENTKQHIMRPRQHEPSVAGNHFPMEDQGQPSGSSLLDPSQAWSTLMSISQLLPPYINPNIYTTPVSPASWSSLDSSVYQGLPQVSVHTASAQTNHGWMDQRGKEQIMRSQMNIDKQILSTAATQTTPQDIPAHGIPVLPEPVSTHNYSSMHEPTLDLPEPVFTHNYSSMHEPTLHLPEPVSTHNYSSIREPTLHLPEPVFTHNYSSMHEPTLHLPEPVSTHNYSSIREPTLHLPEPVFTHNYSSMHEPTIQFSTHSASLPSLHHLGNPDPSQQTFLPPHLTPYTTHRYLPAKVCSDNVSQTSRLLVEIATLKKENEELKEKLKTARNELESQTSNAKKNTEDVSLDRIGSMIEEIRAAEKKRGVALKVLVGDVDEDRPAEVDQHDHLKKKYVSKSVQAGFSDSEFSETEDLYERLPGFSDVSLTDSGGDNVTSDQRKQKYVELLIARQREIMKVEMQKVLDERNEARQRVLKLEKKLSTLEPSCYKDNRANALLAKLRVTEKERDMAVARLKYLTQDVNETKLMYRLHKALLSDSPVNQTSVYPGPKTSNLDNDPTEKKPINSVLSREVVEKAKLEAKIVLMEKEKHSQLQQIEKLHQLIERQRQKINALCEGPMLMEPN